MAIIEDAGTTSRIERVKKLLERAELNEQSDNKDLHTEAANIRRRVAELVAQYGITDAMLQATGRAAADKITDKVIYVSRPFSNRMLDLLWTIAYVMGAQGRSIKEWDPQAHGGRKKGAWRYGLRLFAFSNDLATIEMLYSSYRNQAMSGMARIVDTSSEFGQTQKAERDSYLDGFQTGVYSEMDRARREAERAAQAKQDEAKDLAMLDGGANSEPGVALVLSNRKEAVKVAMDLAYGITQAQRLQWEKSGQEQAAKWREERAAEKAACPRCKNDRPCRKHGTAAGRPSYQRVGQSWGDGYTDGRRAARDTTSHAVSEDGTLGIGG